MLQNSKKKLAIAAGAALIGSAVLTGAAFGGSAQGESDRHTLKFVATSDRNHQAGRFGFEGTEIERNHGRFVGYDVITGKFNPATQRVKIYIAISRQGGLMFGRVHNVAGTQDRYTGKVTGGSGRFRGAEGTIHAHNAPHDDSRTFVTVHYTLP